MPTDRKPPNTPRQPGHYQVLARRFRPTTFDELVGQDAILESLSGALKSGCVPHAFLFSGSRGVGKTTLARILARCLNCETGVTPAPCGQCRTCETILDGSNGDVVEIDAASHNLVDDIRELRERVGFASMGARTKVYILDEVHMLTRNAFNAFLKTLEEPPPNVVFILATTELHKVPETIRSRCQILLFQRIEESDITRRLQRIAADEGMPLPDDVILEIARGARGGMRDAETALERILPVAREKHANGEVFAIDDYRRLMHRAGLDQVVDVVQTLLRGEAAPAMHFVADLVTSGVDEREVLGEVLEVLRTILLLKVDGADSALVGVGGTVRDTLIELAGSADLVQIDAMVQAGLLGRERIRRVDDRRLVLEVSMLRMAQAGRLTRLDELVAEAGRGAASSAGSEAAQASAAPSPVASVRPATPAAPAATLRDRLLAACAEKKGLLRRTLELCSVAEPDAKGVVRIAVETDRKLHRDRMTSDGVQRDLRAMVAEILGHPVELSVTLERVPGAVAEPEPPAQLSQSVDPGPGVRKVLDRFDGKVLNVDKSADKSAETND